MTLISIFGVGVGVAALIIILSVMAGFEKDLINKMLGDGPHLQIVSKPEALGFSQISKNQSWLSSIFSNEDKKSLESYSPFIKTDAVVKHYRSLAPITLLGLDPEDRSDLWPFRKAIGDYNFSQLGSEYAPLLRKQTGIYKLYQISGHLIRSRTSFSTFYKGRGTNCKSYRLKEW